MHIMETHYIVDKNENYETFHMYFMTQQFHIRVLGDIYFNIYSAANNQMGNR